MGQTCGKKSSGRSAHVAGGAPSKEVAPPSALSRTGYSPAESYKSSSAEESMATVGAQLEAVMNVSYAVMGEQPLRVDDNLARMLDLAAEQNKKVRDLNPDFWQEEMNREGALGPDLMEMATLAEWVFHAHLAYESDSAVIRANLAQCGMVLMHHTRADDDGPSSPTSPQPKTPRSPWTGTQLGTQPAGKQISHYIAFDPSRRLAVLSIRGAPRSVSRIGEHLIAPSEPLAPPAAAAGCPGGQAWPAAPRPAQDWAHSGFAAAARAVVEDTAEIVQYLLAPQGYLLVVTGHSLGAGVASCAAKLLNDKGVPLQCYTFATPPCLARSSALGCVGYITSVVHGDDAVPRASLRNIKMMGSIFQAANESRRAPASSQQFDHQAILARGAAAARLEPEKDLFVPGKVVFLYRNSAGQCQASSKNGTLSTLRRIELTPSCLSDHLCEEYIKATAEVAGRLCGRAASDFAPWTEMEPAATASMPSSPTPAMQTATPGRQALSLSSPPVGHGAPTSPAPGFMVSPTGSQLSPPAAPLLPTSPPSLRSSTQPAGYMLSSAGSQLSAPAVPSLPTLQAVPTAPPSPTVLQPAAPATVVQAAPQTPTMMQAAPPVTATAQPQLAVQAVPRSTPSQPQAQPQSARTESRQLAPAENALQAIQGRWFHRDKLEEGGVVVIQNQIQWKDGHKTEIVAHGDGVFTTTWKGTAFQGVVKDGSLCWNDGDVWLHERVVRASRPAGGDVDSDSDASGSSASASSAASSPAMPRAASAVVSPAGHPAALMPVPEEASPNAAFGAGLQAAPSYLMTWEELEKDPALSLPMVTSWQQPGVVRGIHTAQFGLPAGDAQPAVVTPPVPWAVPAGPDALSRTVFPVGTTMQGFAPQSPISTVPTASTGPTLVAPPMYVTAPVAVA